MHTVRLLIYTFFSAQGERTQFVLMPSHTHHSNGITAEHLVCIHDNVVSYIGQDVDHCDNGHRNSDGQGQVPTTENQKSCFYSFKAQS